MKKIACYLVTIVIFVLCGCGTKNGDVSKSDTVNVIEKNSDTIESKDANVESERKSDTKEKFDSLTKDSVIRLFNMGKDEITEYFDSDYEVIKTGVEDIEVGYKYNNGFLIVFDEAGDHISRMELSDNIVFEGVHAGMNFEEIKKIMGDTEIQEADYETNIVYKISYDLDTKVRCSFISNSKDGNESELIIH